MSDSGLTLTRQPPVSATATNTVTGPASSLWSGLAADLTATIEETVINLVGDEHAGRRALSLEAYGVTALEGLFASAMSSLADANPIREERVEQARRLISGFGAAERSAVGVHAPIDELSEGPLAILEAPDRTVTISVRVGQGFRDLRAGQREDVVGLLADLADVADLHVVAGRATQLELRARYHDRLPVSRPDTAPPTRGTIQTRVETAREALDHDSREVSILRDLADETSEALSYHALYAGAQVSDQRVRQCVGKLREHDLVATFDGPEGRTAELLRAGRKYLDALDSEIGVQQSVSECVSDSQNQPADSRVTPHAHEAPHHPPAEGESGGQGRGGYHQTYTAARHRAAATAATATVGDVVLADHPIEHAEDPESQYWHYDEAADRLVAGAQYTGPLQHGVGTALALADQRTFRHVLTPERLEADDLGDLLEGHTDLLRNSRCLGYLADADATGEAYRDALLQAAEDLREMTLRMSNGDYDDRDRFRGAILREAHGLAGTIVHLLDLADVELVQEFRIPEFARDFDAKRKSDLVETIAKRATIGSRYGHFAAYRQLVEERDEKVRSAVRPDVDAANPAGELIGSFVIVGDGVDEDFADRLREAFDGVEPREDAPEFAVPVEIEAIGAGNREHHAQAARRVLRYKSLSLTRSSISILAALAGTPWDTAAALHELGAESKAPGRDLRLDEVRFALATLDTDSILPEMSKPALSSIVHALLDAEDSLSQGTLADRAGVSTQSVRNHAERLAAFDLVRCDEGGWRFALPFQGSERGEPVAPWFVIGDESTTTTFTRDVLSEALAGLEPARYADSDDPLGAALFEPPGEVIPALREAVGWLDPWVRLTERLLGHGQATAPIEPVTVGEPPSQASLAKSAQRGVAD